MGVSVDIDELSGQPPDEGCRRKVWERTVEEWLQQGYAKRIDPLLFNSNKDVYTRLQELLSQESIERNAQVHYLDQSTALEVQNVKADLARRIEELELNQKQFLTTYTPIIGLLFMAIQYLLPLLASLIMG